MAIPDDQLAAVRRVLAGEVTLATVATDYSPTVSMYVAAAILWAGGWLEAEFKGQYGQLLQVLDRAPAVPPGDFAELDYDQQPDWYTSKRADGLVALSRARKVHHVRDPSGNQILFYPPQELRVLARQPEYYQLARQYTAQAVETVRSHRTTKRDARAIASARRAALRRALRRDTILGSELGDWLSFYDTSSLWEIYNALGRILEEYAPERNPQRSDESADTPAELCGRGVSPN